MVRPGRSFLRRMIDLLHATHRPPASKVPIRLSQGFRADLAWWKEFTSQWNGTSFLNPPSRLPKAHLYTDSSGSWGCAAWHEDAWFQVQWDARARPLSIAEKELIPVILACQIWGSTWGGLQIVCHSDNQSVVADLRSRSSKHKGMMHLLRCLAFVEAQVNFSLYPIYIDTKANYLADSLSRNDVCSFLSKVPSAAPHPSPVSQQLLIPAQCPSSSSSQPSVPAAPHPSPVSQQLLDLLLNQEADWTSQIWRRHFKSVFTRA